MEPYLRRGRDFLEFSVTVLETELGPVALLPSEIEIINPDADLADAQLAMGRYHAKLEVRKTHFPQSRSKILVLQTVYQFSRFGVGPWFWNTESRGGHRVKSAELNILFSALVVVYVTDSKH